MISPAAISAVDAFLAQRAALSGASENTLKAYRGDLLEFLAAYSYPCPE